MSLTARRIVPGLLVVLCACGSEQAKQQQLQEEPMTSGSIESPTESEQLDATDSFAKGSDATDADATEGLESGEALDAERLDALRGLGYVDAPADDQTLEQAADAATESLESVQQQIADLQVRVADRASLLTEARAMLAELSPEQLLAEEGQALQARIDELGQEIADIRAQILELTDR